MTLGQYLEIGSYAVLACGVTLLNWRRPTRAAGLALVSSCVISTLAYTSLPFGALVVTEIMLATFLSTVSAVLWAEGDAPKTHQAVMGLCVIDTAFCGVICLNADSGHGAQVLFSHGASLLFVAMCFVVAAPGVMDVVRDRRSHGSSERYDDFASPARRDA